MHTVVKGRWAGVLLVLLLVLLGALGLRAQPGAPLREVTRLARVAEPPGGLIPYRSDKLWGYADTTGRVVIRPCLYWDAIQETAFFDQGFVRLDAYIDPEALLPLPGRATSKPKEFGLQILNARGELLRVRPWEAAVQQPDGSLQCLPRAQAQGRRELFALVREPWQNTGFNAGLYHRVGMPDSTSALPPAPPGAAYGKALGAHRVAWEAAPASRPPAGARHQLAPPTLYALGDERGRLLTGYQFAAIAPFQEGRAAITYWLKASAAARRDGRPAATTTAGYLDTLGRVVIPARYERVSAFRYGRAVVETATQYGIIDRQGHYLLPLQTDPLAEPDAGGFIKRTHVVEAAQDTRQIRYLPPPGQPGPEQTFDEGEAFAQGRAVVRQGARVGLIDEAGHWVTPEAYQRLHTAAALRSQPNLYGDLDEEQIAVNAAAWPLTATLEPGHARPDARYLVARRAGKIGIVARATGLEVVPAVYDSILLNPLYGMASLSRAGRPYVVALATGRAVAGTYQGFDFQTARGRRLYLTRTQPQAWALADTTGQLRTAWIPGTGYPTPEGWLLSHEPQGWTLRDTTGRLALASPTPIKQPEWDRLWDEARRSAASRWGANTIFAEYWRLPLTASNPYARGVFVVPDTAAHRLRLLDARLHEVGQYALPAAGQPPLVVSTLRSYWHYVAPRKPGRGLYPTVQPGDPFQLVTDTGRRLAPVPGAPWAYFSWFDYPRAWYQHGVLPTTQGYVTRGGRKLWE